MKFISILSTCYVVLAVSPTWADDSVNHITDGTVIEAKITKADAPFRFMVRVEDFGIDKIDVYSGKRLLQSIKFPDDAQEMPCSSCNLLEFKDLNFDGYKDVLILVGWGSGGSMYEPWIYNPQKKLFEKSDFDREFANPSLDQKNHILILSSHVGCCEGTKSYYKYRNDRFVLFKEDRYFVENKRDVVVVKQLENGTWKVISKKYGDLRE
jgi:hypothetical protein